jgi:hypothetical protein
VFSHIEVCCRDLEENLLKRLPETIFAGLTSLANLYGFLEIFSATQTTGSLYV